MAQQTLKVTTTNSKGKDYNNINLKELEVGNYILVEKIFPEGREVVSSKYKDSAGNPTVSYACKVKYNGQDVGFWLKNKREYSQFCSEGGIGDTLLVTMTEEPSVNPKTKIKSIYPRLKFQVYEGEAE